MNTTSLRLKPALASASKIQSSMGRPMTSTRVLGIWSVLWPRRLPRPAPITMARTARVYPLRPGLSVIKRGRAGRWRSFFAQLGQHAQVFERRNIALGLAAGGDVLQQPAHDLTATRLRQAVGETHRVGPGELSDLICDVLGERLLHFGRRAVGRLERYEDDQGLSFQIVRASNGCRFCDRGVGDQRAFDLCGTDAMTGDVEHVVDATDHVEVAVRVFARAVASEVRTRDLAPIGLLVTLVITIDGAQHARPRLL